METKIKNLLSRLAFFAEDGMAEPPIVAIAKDADALLKEMYLPKPEQQPLPVARDVLMALAEEVKKACGKAWGSADEGKEYAAIRNCNINAIIDRYATKPPAVAVAVAAPDGSVPVPLGFLQAFHALAHNYSLQAQAPDHYAGTERDAFSDAYARCSSELAKLRAMLAAAPQATAEDSSAVLQAVAVPKAPTWYKRSDIVKALERMNYHTAIADELADWFLRHMQLAFNRGFYQAHGPAAATQLEELELWHLLERATGELTRRAAPHAWEQIAWRAGTEFIEQRRARLAAAPQAAVAAQLPPYDTFSDNDGDSWREHPADADFVDGLQLGDEFELLAGWRSVRVTFRVTKVPDNESDDYEVEEVEAPAAAQKGGAA